MKKILLGSTLVIAIVAVSGYAFRAPLLTKLESAVTADMFVPEDSDAYDPGLTLGVRFPAIAANTPTGKVTDVGGFIRDNGMIFVAVRSADW